MEFRRLGRSGLDVSVIGLGTNNFGGKLDEAGARRVFDASFEGGVNFVDTADGYGGGESETLIGRIVGNRRHDVVLATKFASPRGEARHRRGTSRRWITLAVEESLQRLQTDYIDLYQIHRPDPETPILETLQALDDLVRQGKVRYIGHSNFRGWQIADAGWTARVNHLTVPISAQNHYNLFERGVEADVLPACGAFGVGQIPYFPLASGFLTGKYRKGVSPEGARLTGSPRGERVFTDENFDRIGRLEAYAKQRGHGLTELALDWLLGHPEVSTVIASATTPEHVAENLKASDWQLTPEEVAEVGAL
ncbi:MAG TPA: aldo/keto reductase [Candidatus Dormibacteraeota bacterium]|jgi:aryl-alcohol dehydrogenase-like predicted oxidoreductase|nr:aldo/keto reductase [Candidatus Dormibacteraeota bacterium]